MAPADRARDSMSGRKGERSSLEDWRYQDDVMPGRDPGYRAQEV